MHNKSSEQTVPNIRQNYVYLPFKKKECSEKIVEEVNLCIKNAMEQGTENYQFIAYGKKQLSNLPPNSRIYIIGYGIDLSSVDTQQAVLKSLPAELHKFAVSGGEEAIGINTIVDRMISDGLFTSDLLTIKLWFSDYNDTALLIADAFKSCLKKFQTTSRFLIDYYPHHALPFPCMQNDEPHTWAIDVKTQQRKRASEVRQSLFFNTESEKFSKPSDMKSEFVDFFATMGLF